jgi:hypothetical protein
MTAAEAQVIASLLASLDGDERFREQSAGVPRTTYQTVRRRIFDGGWLEDRYVPSAAAVGARSITIRLSQPFAEHHANLVRERRSAFGSVLVWSSPESVFSVSFDQAGGPNDRVLGSEVRDPIPAKWLRRTWSITCTPDAVGIPVYFDYEGSWSRRIGRKGSISYPQSIPVSSTQKLSASPSDLATLLARPFSTSGSRPGSLLFSMNYLSRRQRRLIQNEWVKHRVFPVLSEFPPFKGSRDERVVFLTGLLKPGASLLNLRTQLKEQASVTPFLAAQASSRVIMGLLSPAPQVDREKSRSTTDIFQESLREIETVREPLETLLPAVNHRYDRLLEPVRDLVI